MWVWGCNNIIFWWESLPLELICFLLVGLIGALLIYLSFMGLICSFQGGGGLICWKFSWKACLWISIAFFSVGLVGALLKERVWFFALWREWICWWVSFYASYILTMDFWPLAFYWPVVPVFKKKNDLASQEEKGTEKMSIGQLFICFYLFNTILVLQVFVKGSWIWWYAPAIMSKFNLLEDI